MSNGRCSKPTGPRPASRKSAKRQARLNEARKAALPVTLGQLDPACRMTLAEAGPAQPSVSATSGRRCGLYTAETVVAEYLARKQALPDAEVTPAGALV